jgi:glycerate 2-kinase
LIRPPGFQDHSAHLAALCDAALRAADPAAAVSRSLSPQEAAGYERVFVVGAGKAGVPMARATAEILGDCLTGGVVSVPQAPAQPVGRLTFIEGGHPLPTGGSLAAGRAIADLLAQSTARDLVVALISGGGSALLELPRPGLSLDDLQCVNQALLKCGAAIQEINLVRQHLSEIKGGGLLRLAYPASVLGLILSDVVGNPLHLIASGPTVTAETSPADVLQVIEKYGLEPALPAAVLHCLAQPDSEQRAPGPQSVTNRLIASNRLAGEAAAARACELGFDAVCMGDDWQGDALQAGRRFAELVARAAGPALPGQGAQPKMFVAGGETTVVVRGRGKGGRNQEAALAAAVALAGRPGVTLATLATDGVDGPTDAAGAVVTGDTVARARALGMEPQAYLDDNNAYAFFAALGDLLITGPTGTNVNDLMFGLAYPPAG